MESDGEGLRRCKSCEDKGLNTWHPLTDFHRDKNGKDGLSFYCRSCYAERKRKYRRPTKPAIVLTPEQQEQQRMAKREKAKQVSRDYYYQHREEIRQKTRGRNAAYYTNNKDRLRAYKRMYTNRRYHNDPVYRERLLTWQKNAQQERRILTRLIAWCLRGPHRLHLFPCLNKAFEHLFIYGRKKKQ